jgi:hypothetical protein
LVGAANAGWPPVPRTGVGSSAILPELNDMPKFLIEREVPGASELSAAELHSIAQRSVGVLRQLGPEIQWVESYVAGNNIYCVYVAPDAEMVREHGRLGCFPCNKVSEIKQVIDPTTAE